jgi:hypothetical protein
MPPIPLARPTMQTQNQIVGPDTITRMSAATAQSNVPIAIGSLAVSDVNHLAIRATYSTSMNTGVRRFVTLLVLVSLVGAVVMAAMAGVVFAA